MKNIGKQITKRYFTLKTARKMYCVLLFLIGYTSPTQSLQQIHLNNVALLKPSWLSSQVPNSANANYSNANDGKKKKKDLCAHTKSRDNSPWRWWRVDLEHLFDIYIVSITNRADCCGERLRNFEVRVATVFDNLTVDKQDERKERVCYYHKEAVQQGATVTLNCNNAPVLGQFVTVIAPRMSDKNGNFIPLTLCEVEVYGMQVAYLGEDTRNENSPSKGRAILKAGFPCGASQLEPSVCESMTFCQLNASQTYVCVIFHDGKCVGNEAFCEDRTVCDQGTCKPTEGIVGGSCIMNSKCTQPNVVCKRTGNPSICVCDENHVISHQNLSCTILREGQNCSGNRSLHCREGTICDQDYICRINAGEECEARNSQYCQSGAVCDRDKCRNLVAQICSIDIPCRLGHVCEESMCRINAGEKCEARNSQYCQSDAVCDRDKCRNLVGKNCRTDIPCRLGLICEQNVCKYNVYENCTDHPDLCKLGSMCDTAGGKNVCRLKAGEKCEANNSQNCYSGAVCDKDICRNLVGKNCSMDIPCRLGHVCEQSVCKFNFGEICTDNKKLCKKGLVCDKLNRCRISKGGDCNHDLDKCLAGAHCLQSKCQCNGKYTQTDTDLCEPQAGVTGGNCSSSFTCYHRNSDCNKTSNICMCKKGYAIDRNDYSCKLIPGANCSLNPEQCITGTKCDSEKLCMLKVNENCFGQYRKFCQRDSICGDTNICLLGANGNCRGNARNSCDSKYHCDAMNICKYLVGDSCDSSNWLSQCMAGAHCDEDVCRCNEMISNLNAISRTCEPKPKMAGGVCNPTDASACEDLHAVCSNVAGTCQCTYPYTIAIDLTCKLSAGTRCGPHLESCIYGTICDGNICKLIEGSRCEDSRSTLCETGTVCDSRSECRLDYGVNCQARENHCRSDSHCDYLKQCRIPVGDNCSAREDQCTAWGFCSNGKCVCREMAVPNGLLCGPAPGELGGACLINNYCLDPNAYCNILGLLEICVCTDGYEANSTELSCYSQTKGIHCKQVFLVLVTIFGLLVPVVPVVICYALSSARQSRLKKQQKVIAEGYERRLALKRLSECVTRITSQVDMSGHDLFKIYSKEYDISQVLEESFKD